MWSQDRNQRLIGSEIFNLHTLFFCYKGISYLNGADKSVNLHLKNFNTLLILKELVSFSMAQKCLPQVFARIISLSFDRHDNHSTLVQYSKKMFSSKLIQTRNFRFLDKYWSKIELWSCLPNAMAALVRTSYGFKKLVLCYKRWKSMYV